MSSAPVAGLVFSMDNPIFFSGFRGSPSLGNLPAMESLLFGAKLNSADGALTRCGGEPHDETLRKIRYLHENPAGATTRGTSHSPAAGYSWMQQSR